ncbi:MBOAT family protein [Accumulibacter sp.]|uniref:MBOAT family O-acyltransferase n=1 Tax=Accumulibacter sp. TaxID=2053492 RepID=UPI0025E1EDC9|nr:MBOAT family protein [Accumulibacter sp.]MCP5230005.1 MBOAT family protein [Accumulibacter sp.]
MLFNSFEFIFLFLPITLLLYFLSVRFVGNEFGLGLLVLASLFFYGWWNPVYTILFLFSIAVNYALGGWLIPNDKGNSKLFLVIGVVINLGLLGYFKYANFFVDNLNLLAGTSWHLHKVFLPLAISFFTFQQISYLVDAWQGDTREYNFLHYCLFVCFFPQLIAGPIVHHKEMLPQFMLKEVLQPRWSNFAIGISIFFIGLFKKTVIADSLSLYVGPVYDNPLAAQNVDFFLAWGSTLAYTFQLYFDFSGYSDMAIGCARMFGIKLPVNFFSPYKSSSIIEFWHRWHITLSRFLRDYLYISLGGNKKGKARRYANLFITMLLGGLWHGAGWTFVIWGALHGSYLMVNNAWRRLMQVAGFRGEDHRAYQCFCWLVTFLGVILAWVYFRAPTLEQGNTIILAMLGFNGAELPAGIVARMGWVADMLALMGVTAGHGSGSSFVGNFLWVLVGALGAVCLPNVAQIFHHYEPVLYEHEGSFKGVRDKTNIRWSYSMTWASITAFLGLLGVLTLTQISEFLYFQF